MASGPYDFNRDDRWSTPERAFTHYGIGGELRRADGGGPAGEGRALPGASGRSFFSAPCS